VNGLEVWVETPRGRYALSSQRYHPDVIFPDGYARIEEFDHNPWPTWTFRAEDGTEIRQEIVVRRGQSEVLIAWRLEAGNGPIRLHVRPLLSGRDYHGLHRENGAFRFDPTVDGETVTWRPYEGLPSVLAMANGPYRHEPDWYRNFLYVEERNRGLDCIEDLASPGCFTWELSSPTDAVLILRAERVPEPMDAPPISALAYAGSLREMERRRRSAFPSPLHRSADDYLVRRGDGLSIVAGYPWFTDWGRDAFIALRGLYLNAERMDRAREILLAWAATVSEGMLPNRFPDAGESPEYNSVDASLWYVVAVHDYLRTARELSDAADAATERRLRDAIQSILQGYSAGTRFGIRMDADGLLACGVPGVQLTWMDARIGDWVVTPRIGKPVEVQALWLNALRIGGDEAPKWLESYRRGLESFVTKFWREDAGCLHDVVDVDHVPGKIDSSFRPNQVFSVGGLPFPILDGERARRVVDAIESKLLTPLGLRSLAPGEVGYRSRYEGGVWERDSAYHQGTVWPWLMGPFVEAWLRVRGFSEPAKAEATRRFVQPLLDHLEKAGLGHMSEIADAEEPHTPRGCPFQAWSLGELMRAMKLVEGEPVTPERGRASRVRGVREPGGPEEPTAARLPRRRVVRK
jgi:predicted glycogen debranching enzyme